ncbi:MAG: hypothetical protein AAGA55_12610, partial [Planctomycetota bacterium]
MPADPSTPSGDSSGRDDVRSAGRAISARLDLLESRLIAVEKRLGMSGGDAVPRESAGTSPGRSQGGDPAEKQ